MVLQASLNDNLCTCNEQCEANTLTDGATDSTTQVLSCTEQNSNIIKVYLPQPHILLRG